MTARLLQVATDAHPDGGPGFLTIALARRPAPGSVLLLTLATTIEGTSAAGSTLEVDGDASSLEDGETLTLTDAEGTTRVFEFDDDASVGGGNVPITLSQLGSGAQESADDVGIAIALAVNTDSIKITAEDDGDGVLLLEQDVGGAAGNTPVVYTGASPTFAVNDFEGGGFVTGPIGIIATSSSFVQNGVTWTQVSGVNGTGNPPGALRIEVYRASDLNGIEGIVSSVLTVPLVATEATIGVLEEYSDLLPGTDLDQASSATGLSAKAIAPPTATTTQDEEVWRSAVAIIDGASQIALTAGQASEGWALIANVTTGNLGTDLRVGVFSRVVDDLDEAFLVDDIDITPSSTVWLVHFSTWKEDLSTPDTVDDFTDGWPGTGVALSEFGGTPATFGPDDKLVEDFEQQVRTSDLDMNITTT